MKNAENRNLKIDVLRGIATISVILGHSIQRGLVTGYENNIFFKIICTFHMPLFMVLSGYTLGMSNTNYDKKYVISRGKRLIYPTIIWSYLLYFVRNINFTGLLPFVKFPDSIINYTEMLLINPDFVIWFLYVVFICTLIMVVGNKFFNNQLLIYLVTILILVELSPVSSILGIGKLKLYLPIFMAGYFINQYKDIFFKYLPYMIFPCILIYVPLADEWSDSSPLFYKLLIAFASITIIYYFVNSIKVKLFNKAFSFLGKYSLEIYLCQCLVLNIGFGEGVIRVMSIMITATVLAISLAYITSNNKHARILLYGLRG